MPIKYCIKSGIADDTHTHPPPMVQKIRLELLPLMRSDTYMDEYLTGL